MSGTGCPALTMLSAFLLTTFAALASQQPSANPTATSAEIQDLLQRKVLKQGQKTYWVQDILDQLYPHDPSLKVSLESNVEYFTAYVNSLRFYDQVRWYSNKLILDQHKIPKATAKQIEAEAKAWASDRNDRPSSVSSSMAVAGIEIEVRARLMALQPEEFSNKEIRALTQGRVVQLSYYAGPNFYNPPTPAHPEGACNKLFSGQEWPWNPIGAGDIDGNHGAVLNISHTATSVHVVTRPLQWACHDVVCECEFEQHIELDGTGVHVTATLPVVNLQSIFLDF